MIAYRVSPVAKFVLFNLGLKLREDFVIVVIVIGIEFRNCGDVCICIFVFGIEVVFVFLYLGLRLVRSWEEEVEKKRVQYAALQSTPRMAAVKSHPSDCYIFGSAKLNLNINIY